MNFDHGNALSRNEHGRWYLDDVELSSGSHFEVRIRDHWIRVVIEYDGPRYIVTPRCIRLHRGLSARLLGQYTD